MPDFVLLDEPDVVVSVLPLVPEPDVEPVPPLVVPLPVVPDALPDRLVVDGEVGLPLIPPAPVPERVVDDEDELVPVSRPWVASRSEHAPRASVLRAAATATPIALAFINFIVTPDFDAENISPDGDAGAPGPSRSTPGETL